MSLASDMPAPVKKMRKAIVLDTPGHAVIMEVPVPSVRPLYCLVKPTAVALNAVDYYSIDHYGANGTITGCDFAGEVLEVGSGVQQDLKPGDRVAGFVHGNKTDSMDVISELFKSGESGDEGSESDPLLAALVAPCAFTNTCRQPMLSARRSGPLQM
jgi:hypothetical protein